MKTVPCRFFFPPLHKPTQWFKGWNGDLDENQDAEFVLSHGSPRWEGELNHWIGHVPCPMSWLFCYPLRDGKASEIEIGQGLGEW